jgi:hypothetical protein
VTKLSSRALAKIPSLKSVTFEFGSRLQMLERWTFSGCSSLQSICVPASVEILEDACFFNLPNLSSVTFESGSRLREIGDQVFGICPLLKSIFIPASVSVIDQTAFTESSIEEIVVDLDNPNYCTSGHFLIELEGLTLVRYFGSAENVIISAESDLWKVKTGDRLEAIGPYAFSESTGLKSICIPASVEIIGEECFRACTFLVQLTFAPGSRLTRIGEYAIRECTSLPSICIPTEVEAIPYYCFSECHSLEECVFERDSKLVRIREKAFQNCRSLRSITIQTQLVMMDFCALLGCESLRKLIFETPSNLKQLDLPPSDFGTLLIPDRVEVVRGSIGSQADRSRVLQIGRESRLGEIDLKTFESLSFVSIVGEPGNQVFVRLSKEVMRRFRYKFESF